MAILTNPPTLQDARDGKNSIFLPILGELFNNLVEFGANGFIRNPFTPFVTHALKYGLVVLVSDDLNDGIDESSEKLSDLFPYKYQTFNRKTDSWETIKMKINNFIKEICTDRKLKAKDLPKYNVMIDTNITNIIFTCFFNIQLEWRYTDIFEKSLKFYSFNDETSVDGFCIPRAFCASRIYIINDEEKFLLVRIPVNNIKTKTKEVEDDEDAAIMYTNYIEPWQSDPNNDSFLETIDSGSVYLTIVAKISKELPIKKDRFANLETYDPEKLCEIGEKLIVESFKKKSHPMLYRTVCVSMPNIETNVKFSITKHNYKECGVGIVDEGTFSKEMSYFAKKIPGRNITIDSVTSDTKIRINQYGIVLTGMMSGYATDYVHEYKPPSLDLNVPMVYSISVGKRVIGAGIFTNKSD